MLGVTGYGSKIVKELIKILPEEENLTRIGWDLSDDIPECGRYLLCAGVIRPKMLEQQTASEIAESINCILIGPMRMCDEILKENDGARICVIGSESGFSWSYDGVYAASKAALHRYVETKKLGQKQQLVCVAPSIIEDSGMTESRKDVDNLRQRMEKHPKRRFLKASEVARLVHFLLYQDEGYLSSQVIRFNGGV